MGHGSWPTVTVSVRQRGPRTHRRWTRQTWSNWSTTVTHCSSIPGNATHCQGPCGNILTAQSQPCLRTARPSRPLAGRSEWDAPLDSRAGITLLYHTFWNNVHKKLSYRRETARQLCMSTYRLANWSCNAQNTTESQRLYCFWHSNALIQKVLAENAFCHEITNQGHSRSFILQSFAGRQGVAYRHIILLAVSLTFSKT